MKLINEFTKIIRQLQSNIDQTPKNKYESMIFHVDKYKNVLLVLF